MALTLTYAGTTKTLAAWGFTEPRMRVASQQASTFTVRVPGAASVLADPPIPWLGQVTVQKDGVTIFVGRQTTDAKRAQPGSPADQLTFSDAWWDLERCTFFQTWSTKDLAGHPITTTAFSRVTLFQQFSTPWVLQDAGAQIREILSWAIASGGVNLQIGAIDPDAYLPPYPARSIKCAAAILLCLKASPDAVTWIDYGTVPPTFNCRFRHNLDSATLPFADGATHRSSEVVARYDLQVSDVVIQYQKELVDNGATFTNIYDDVYPAGSTGAGPQSLTVAIDLRGARASSVIVQAAAFDPRFPAWWQVKKPEFGKTQLVGGVPQAVYQSLAVVSGSVTVTDAAGTVWAWPGPLSATPNEVVSGEVQSWMSPVVAQQVTVSAMVTYTEVDPLGRPVLSVSPAHPHTVSARVMVTNSAAGTVPYLQFFDPGDSPLEWSVGGVLVTLAEYLWQSNQWLPHEGSHTIAEVNAAGFPEPSRIWGPWLLLNLSGGRAEWAAMDAVVQSVEIDFSAGTTDISFGPPAHIAPGDLFEMVEWIRHRNILDRLSLRSSGDAGASGWQQGGANAKENTTAGQPPASVFEVHADMP